MIFSNGSILLSSRNMSVSYKHPACLLVGAFFICLFTSRFTSHVSLISNIFKVSLEGLQRNVHVCGHLHVYTCVKMFV